MARARSSTATVAALLVLLLLVVVLLVALRGDAGRAGDSAAAGGGPGAGVVTHVVDGDTIDVDLGGGAVERVRLIGIDTPETVDPDRPVGCHGPEASALTHSLLPDGTVVHLERDVEARDRYGRLLAYVFREPDGLFVNEAIAAAGEAEVLSIEPNTHYAGVIAAAVATARAADLGLWGACPQAP